MVVPESGRYSSQLVPDSDVHPIPALLTEVSTLPAVGLGDADELVAVVVEVKTALACYE